MRNNSPLFVLAGSAQEEGIERLPLFSAVFSMIGARTMAASRLLMFLLACFAVQRLLASDPLFYESFDETFEGRWTVSEKEDYKGTWKHSKSEGHEDFGLLASEPARKYAIVKEAEEAIELKGRTVVLQYEARLQNGLECGGAYLKFLRPQAAGWSPREFDNESPYSIMFGPDKCGATNKVHFILKMKNPKTGAYAEHHLKLPPSVPYDKLSHVYTAVLTPDNRLKILLDGEEKKAADLLSADDFDPPLVPPETIPDPDDAKPEDWDERPKIPDPEAAKPEDWDEDAPAEIEDEDAVKPEGWLDDEPEEIDDPEATKPEDWDDEEDGQWEAPKVDNPRCEAAPGCGEWKRPTKKNPAYKGKWRAPLVDNPAYRGVWKPREIPNPDYYRLDKPDFEPIAAVGIEIWTMQDGILFDNILVVDDEKAAESLRETAWKPKFEAEKAKEKADEDKAAAAAPALAGIQKKVFDLLYQVADIPLLKPYKPKITEVIEKGEQQPNVTIGVLVSVAAVLLTTIFKILFGGKKTKPAARTQPEEAKPEEEEEAAAEETKDEDSSAAAARPRRSRRET
ncbi:calnexin homolog [Wolffia australiana]